MLPHQIELFYLPLRSGHRAEPAARRWRRRRGEVWKCQIRQCKSHATPKSGLWLNTFLDVRALIMHSTRGFCTLLHLGSIDICPRIIYINLCNILMELGDGTVRLHPILDDFGCIPAHNKYMELFHGTDTLCGLGNQLYACYLQYSQVQFVFYGPSDAPESH